MIDLQPINPYQIIKKLQEENEELKKKIEILEKESDSDADNMD